MPFLLVLRAGGVFHSVRQPPDKSDSKYCKKLQDEIALAAYLYSGYVSEAIELSVTASTVLAENGTEPPNGKLSDLVIRVKV